jgi:phospholipase C
VAFTATHNKLDLEITNHGKLGAGLQARSLTVAGAPYSYTVGAGHHLTAHLPRPGTYDLSVHGPNGFYRHYAGSRATRLRVEVASHDKAGRLQLTLSDGEHSGHGHHAVTVKVADAYGHERHVTLHGTEAIVVDTTHSGGWYDIALSSPGDKSFAYALAGRLESGGTLTSDPQLGRA